MIIIIYPDAQFLLCFANEKPIKMVHYSNTHTHTRMCVYIYIIYMYVIV